jgi:hypothetical protein
MERVVAVNLDGISWRRSSWSSGQGDPEKSNCVEVALVDPSVWRECNLSRRPGQDQLVEVAMADTALDTALGTGRDNAVLPLLSSFFTAIRDSKNPGPALAFPLHAWSGLVRRLVG